MTETRRNPHQLLKGKHLYSTLYGVYTEMLPDLTAVLKDSSAKGETAKTIIAESPSNKEFQEQKRRKWKPSDNANKGTKKPATSTMGVNNPQLWMKFPPGTSSPPLRLIEMEADHGDNADDSTRGQQH
jgi:hypothetical protein